MHPKDKFNQWFKFVKFTLNYYIFNLIYLSNYYKFIEKIMIIKTNYNDKPFNKANENLILFCGDNFKIPNLKKII